MLQNRAVKNLFVGPNMIEDVSSTVKRLERGDLKLRVRALEAERALGRVEIWQKIVACGIASSALVNVGTVLSVNAVKTAANLSFLGAFMLGLASLASYFKVGM